MKESTLQIQCVDFLTALAMRYNDLLFFSIPNEHYGITHAQRTTLKKRGLLPGTPDFQILFKGRMFFIEFKKQGEKPNEKQLRIHEKIRQCKFDVFVIDNFEDFKSLMRDEGIR
jgi:hypothetical protein